ncbi:4Fe-4S dicluster domain-containing protein [Streptomyces hokutonensis]|uniref:4Fe-4S dicluster domain-containing protein n=1 Tax=Streptomyces hokutonensis TaxID=1306990 RepID=UPI003F54045F
MGGRRPRPRHRLRSPHGRTGTGSPCRLPGEHPIWNQASPPLTQGEVEVPCPRPPRGSARWRAAVPRLRHELRDNTQGLGASTWRHVAFVEQQVPVADGRTQLPLVQPESEPPADTGDPRWLMSSDVCKHCTHAACLDVCGYCVPACPYGVIEQRPDDGRAFKCTMCYDRLGAGQEPACAKACPTESMQFGPLDELRERAALRVDQLHEAGVDGARLYGQEPDDGVGGDAAFFLLLDEPEAYGLPPNPVVTTRDLPTMWKHAGAAALSLVGGFALSFALPALRGRKGTR